MRRRFDLNEEFVKNIFKKIDNLKMSDEVDNNKDRFDFAFEFNNEKYVVEVKTDLYNSSFNLLLSKMKEATKEIDAKAIIVVIDRVSAIYKNIASENDILLFDISNLLYIINGDYDLLKQLNNLIEFSFDNIVIEKTLIDFRVKPTNYASMIVEELKNGIYEGLKSELNGICHKPGDDKKYEIYLEKVLKYIFLNELFMFENQKRTETGLNIFDLICKIKTGIKDDFFSTIGDYYKTKYIVFEFKNYKEPIKQGQICTTEKYLFSAALRNVAIIISRKGADKNALRMARGILRETGKIIIVLDDNDIKNMIDCARNGEKPSSVLAEKLDSLLMTLEK